ncbi:non-ribosomal peptide synthetase [Actinosynnema pretiosum]|uniref:Thioester reductase n=1 Tax=Actinosynnema pretiosum TaxID=42197 RepID=A0A290Z9N0_9PSEU|nr:non-ribosomal peptide synthetase [Actinosynnema pretiosum]ATE55694.1 thioester reductase [Actinosynnema pretiosum]
MRTIPALFARAAAAHPDRVAVGTTTYAELDDASARLAGALRAGGLRRGQPVAVALERSPLVAVALLGIVRAGGCYLGLDPGDPPARRAALLADSGALLLGEREVLVDGPRAADADVDPEDLAYLAYTSGSTGEPKGVCVPHRAVARLVDAPDFLTTTPDDVFLQHAPLAFDASTLEIWGALLNGARLAVAPPGELSPAELAAFAREQGVTTAWLTAGLFHQVVDTALADLRGVRQLVAGGDVLSPTHVERALRELPGLVLINGYGPTENTTFTACHRMTAPPTTATVPIGTPIRGGGVHLLDADLRPVPDGEVGELHATGDGLALGYLGRPDLTAERFLPDPTAPGARMYRTGDLARRLPGGVLEFVGRADAQVKVRGFRVEPAEVEAQLLRHPDVTGAAVVAQADTSGGRRLAAFYTAEHPVSAPELRRALAERLPRHLVPSTLTRLPALPLTPSGKLDRAALAATPVRTRADVDADYRAPATERERWLAQLWADVLAVDAVGVDDDFFELGGHSLLASRITAEIAGERGLFVRARTFYENPTVAELAEHLGALEESR